MKICITKKEAKSLLNIMDKVEDGASVEFKKALKDTKAVKFHINLTGDVEVNVNEDYMEDFLDLYGKYIGLLVPQVKALYEIVKMFQEEAEDVIHKYI